MGKITNQIKRLNQMLRAYLFRKGYAITSVNQYEKEVKHFYDWLSVQKLSLKKITRNDILSYRSFLQENYKGQRTNQQRLSMLRVFFDAMQSNGLMNHNPATGIHIKGITRATVNNVLTKQQLDNLYNNYEVNPTDPFSSRNKVILGLLIYQAISIGELKKLAVDAIDTKNWILRVPSAGRSNSRNLPLQNNQISQIQEYLHTSRESIMSSKSQRSEQLIINAFTDKLRSTLITLQKQIRKIEPAFINYIQLRNSVLVHLTRDADLIKVKEFTGKRYISSLERYQQVNNLPQLQQQLNTMFGSFQI